MCQNQVLAGPFSDAADLTSRRKQSFPDVVVKQFVDDIELID